MPRCRRQWLRSLWTCHSFLLNVSSFKTVSDCWGCSPSGPRIGRLPHFFASCSMFLGVILVPPAKSCPSLVYFLWFLYYFYPWSTCVSAPENFVAKYGFNTCNRNESQLQVNPVTYAKETRHGHRMECIQNEATESHFHQELETLRGIKSPLRCFWDRRVVLEVTRWLKT